LVIIDIIALVQLFCVQYSRKEEKDPPEYFENHPFSSIPFVAAAKREMTTVIEML
jgi:hypothetical protein